MGFGHRVYKNYDPRAKIIQKACHDVLDELGIKGDPLLDLAMELEKIALNDDYFVDRKLYPNVDFYSGIILKAMGFPTSMFTALFAVARTVGWVSQWKEMMEDPRSASAGRGRSTPAPPSGIGCPCTCAPERRIPARLPRGPGRRKPAGPAAFAAERHRARSDDPALTSYTVAQFVPSAIPPPAITLQGAAGPNITSL